MKARYLASIPERILRSVALTVGGTVHLITDAVFPKSLRSTRFYRFFLDNTMRFLIEEMGGARGVFPRKGKLPPTYLPRKMAGNVADFAGIFAFHFSPLWFFALLGDAAEGTQDYLEKIVAELKREGFLAKQRRVKNADELLQALGEAAARSGTPFDTPPLSMKDLAKLKRDVVGGYRNLYKKSRKVVPSPAELWGLLHETAEREGVSVVRLSGSLALSGAKAVGTATGDLFQEKVIDSYAKSLRQMRKKGFERTMRPYVVALSKAFSPRRRTLTEKLIRRRK